MGSQGGTSSTEDSVIHAGDLALARRVATAERTAFAALFERYADRVHALAFRRTTDEESARDLTERMLARVFGDIPRYRGEISLDWWVLGRCKRVLVDLRADSETRAHPWPEEGVDATGSQS
jgi:DNA-directed RNA polymerase specialized sigma24 family protein